MMETESGGIAARFKQRVREHVPGTAVRSVGVVTQVGDSVARIRGLGSVGSHELLEFGNGVLGMAMNLEAELVSAVLLGSSRQVREGDEVRSTGRVVEVPVGAALLGRIIDPLGRPLDGKGPILSDRTRPMEHTAPDVTKRAPIDTSLHTGLKAIDSMVPIGRGQRELIIGDRSIGKSAIAVDTLSAQRDTDVVSIYVAIGKKLSQVAYIAANLRKVGAFDSCVVVAAGAAEPATLQYLAPYAGCAIAEEFMEHGGDVVIVYDDLTKHAWAYRELSLLLRRPPGREAYPGDVFYLHSRLLERAGKLAPELGGGSMTALPIVETQAGDISAYVPTNLVSITDGQIYLETSHFNAGIRPAVDVGMSVSRVGGSAQRKAMRQVAGRLRLELAQFRELEAFAQFGSSDLDASARHQLERGRRIVEVLKQPQYSPMSFGHEILALFAVTNGYLDDVPVLNVRKWEQGLHVFVDTAHPELLRIIEDDGEIKPGTEALMKGAIGEYRAEASWRSDHGE